MRDIIQVLAIYMYVPLVVALIAFPTAEALQLTWLIYTPLSVWCVCKL